MVEALADLPRLLFLAHRALQIATRHVQPGGIAEDVLERPVHGNVTSACRERRDQLDLIMVILGQRGIRMIDDRVRRNVLHRIGRFLEKERRLARWIGTHFTRMRGVVAPDAINPPYRKHLARSRDGYECRRHGERRARLRSGATWYGKACRASGCEQGRVAQQLPALGRFHMHSSCKLNALWSSPWFAA